VVFYDLIKDSPDYEKYMEIFLQSYFNYLQSYENEWRTDWQNHCSQNNINPEDKKQCFDFIRNEIINKGSSIPSKKKKIEINLTDKERIEYSKTSGNPLESVICLMIIGKKYPNVYF